MPIGAAIIIPKLKDQATALARFHEYGPVGGYLRGGEEVWVINELQFDALNKMDIGWKYYDANSPAARQETDEYFRRLYEEARKISRRRT